MRFFWTSLNLSKKYFHPKWRYNLIFMELCRAEQYNTTWIKSNWNGLFSIFCNFSSDTQVPNLLSPYTWFQVDPPNDLLTNLSWHISPSHANNSMYTNLNFIDRGSYFESQAMQDSIRVRTTGYIIMLYLF